MNQELTEDQKREMNVEATVVQAMMRFGEALRVHGVPIERAKDLWEMAFTAGRLSQSLKSAADFQQLIKSAFSILVAGLLLVGCADARSSGRPQAERVFMDQAGYVCFLVRDEDGLAVGGNCVRE